MMISNEGSVAYFAEEKPLGMLDVSRLETHEEWQY